MKYLFYFYSYYYQDLLGGLLDKAISLSKDPENDVLFAYCGESNVMCHVNPKGSRPMCKLCSCVTKRIIEQYGVKSLNISTIKAEEKTRFDYNSADDLKAIKYRGASIGMSILSTYITLTRNSDPCINKASRRFFNTHLNQSAKFVDRIYSIIESFNPDCIYIFNGRHEDSRAIFDIAKLKNINCVLSEVVFQNDKTNRVFFSNHLVHDILYNKERRDFCWDHYALTNEEKYMLGKSFYSKRRGGLPSGDRHIYISQQEADKIPPISLDKINIGIFNSSEDEFASLGGDWDQLKLFKSQYDGIVYLINNAPKNVHFYLRIHPNLKDVKYKYHTSLLDLKYDNLTVIPGNSKVSTYALMEKMDKVICFGSTMGLEASFWGKPSILLGPCMYYYDDLCYIPSSKEELLEMLVEKLIPKNNDNLYKIGAYILDKSPLFVESENIDFNPIKRYFIKRHYFNCKYVNFLLNEKVTALFLAFARFITDNRFFYRFQIPVLERADED